MKEPKDYVVRGRVSKTMKAAVVRYAEETGETEAIIVREALAEYFEARGIKVGKTALSQRKTRSFKRSKSAVKSAV